MATFTMPPIEVLSVTCMLCQKNTQGNDFDFCRLSIPYRTVVMVGQDVTFDHLLNFRDVGQTVNAQLSQT